MKNAAGINAAELYPFQRGSGPETYSGNATGTRAGSASGPGEKDTASRVSISREAYELKREYAEEKRDAKLEYQQERQALEREYQQEKRRLEREYEQKKESLDINVYI